MDKENQKPDKEAPEKEAPEKEDWGELAKTTIIAVLLAMIIRTFLFEPFNIPSGSMIPNLLVGDYLFVSKYSYGFSRYSFPFGLGGFEGRIDAHKPERGDVIVFKLPTDPSIDYIKRVIGLPGDTIQMINGRLYINDRKVQRENIGLEEYDSGYNGDVKVTLYKETLPNGVVHTIFEESDDGPLDNTDKYTVPENHYFMMGDNRDNSQDSRVLDHVGYVPFDNLVGRAEIIFFSTNGSANMVQFWKWPWTIRYNRLLKPIGNGHTLKTAPATEKTQDAG